MSDSIITRIDEMGDRVDDLERSVGELIAQADDEGATNAATNAEGGDAVAAKR